MSADLSNLVIFVKEYAQEHYNEGGWDVIVECWSDVQIRETIQQAEVTTTSEAVDAFRAVVDIWQDQQAEAEYQTVQGIGKDDYRPRYGEPIWHGEGS